MAVDYKALGLRVRAKRKTMKMSQAELAERVDLSLVLDKSQVDSENGVRFNSENKYDHKLDSVKDSAVLLGLAKPALDNKEKVKIELDILNTDSASPIIKKLVNTTYSAETKEAILNKVTRTLAIIFFVATLAVNIVPIFVK